MHIILFLKLDYLAEKVQPGQGRFSALKPERAFSVGIAERLFNQRLQRLFRHKPIRIGIAVDLLIMVKTVAAVDIAVTG